MSDSVMHMPSVHAYKALTGRAWYGVGICDMAMIETLVIDEMNDL